MLETSYFIKSYFLKNIFQGISIGGVFKNIFDWSTNYALSIFFGLDNQNNVYTLLLKDISGYTCVFLWNFS